MYALTYTEYAKKQLLKLPSKTQERILKALERVRIRPEKQVKQLVGVPYSCLRVGDYRVILQIRGKQLCIFVLDVGHRKGIYKAFKK